MTGVFFLGLLYLRITQPKIAAELRHTTILTGVVVATLAMAGSLNSTPIARS